MQLVYTPRANLLALPIQYLELPNVSKPRSLSPLYYYKHSISIKAKTSTPPTELLEVLTIAVASLGGLLQHLMPKVDRHFVIYGTVRIANS